MSATLSLLFGLLVTIVVLAALATRLRLPYAILLVLGGLLLGFVPGLPTITLDPELILVLFLPPLIYSSAWLTSWREFRASLRPILQLSLGLVLVTTLVIAAVAHAIAGLSWPVAFVLGAVVSPTDAVAASATAKQLGLPRRIVTVIEGESMVNDATGLVVYRFAVAAVVTGSFSLWQASLQFVVVSLGGLVIGLVIAWPVAWLHRHLDDAPIEITITLLTPYAAYLVSDALQVSGVLAVLSAGLYLSRQSSRFFSSNTRLQANAVWNVLVFLLNGLEREHALAHLVAARAALSRLDELTTDAWVPEEALIHLRAHYEKKLEALAPSVDGVGDERAGVHAPMQQRLQQEVLRAERAAVIGLRDQGRIDDETLRLVERELDLEEQRLH